MKHSLDHSTATEANGIIWELCSTCEAWVSQHEHLGGCEEPAPPPEPDPLLLHLRDQQRELALQIANYRSSTETRLWDANAGIGRLRGQLDTFSTHLDAKLEALQLLPRMHTLAIFLTLAAAILFGATLGFLAR